MRKILRKATGSSHVPKLCCLAAVEPRENTETAQKYLLGPEERWCRLRFAFVTKMERRAPRSRLTANILLVDDLTWMNFGTITTSLSTPNSYCPVLFLMEHATALKIVLRWGSLALLLRNANPTLICALRAPTTTNLSGQRKIFFPYSLKLVKFC